MPQVCIYLYISVSEPLLKRLKTHDLYVVYGQEEYSVIQILTLQVFPPFILDVDSFKIHLLSERHSLTWVAGAA